MTPDRTAYDLVRERLSPATLRAVFGYDPSEPRDERGRWTADYKALATEGALNFHEYLDLGYGKLNKALRSKSTPVEMRKIAESIDAHMQVDGKKAAHDMVVYRGVNGDNALWRALDSGRIRVGTVIEDPAFLSTTSNKAIATRMNEVGFMEKAIRMTIDVPAGTRYLTGNANEKELVFGRGTQLKVTSRDTTGELYILRARIIK